MKYYFRLAELIGYEPGTSKRPGLIKQIEEETKLDRHLVSDLLKNKRKSIPLEALSRLCDFLIRHGFVPAAELPGALFAVDPEHFWEMLAERKRFELCLGVRKSKEPDLPGALLSAADAVLLGEMLNGVSTLGGTSHGREGEASIALSDDAPESSDLVLHPAQFKQSLVWSPGQVDDAKVLSHAAAVYRDFVGVQKDRSLVCLGSVKSNPVVELVYAATFGCDPYKSQDSVASATDRSCPFFLRYRDADPHPESCCAGLELSGDVKSEMPGIYYETKSGDWKCVPSDGTQDAAMVFFAHREAQNRVEMVVGGFSGRATRGVAKMLRQQPDSFWPPSCQHEGTRVGAFVVQFTYPSGKTDEDDLVLQTNLPDDITVISIDEEVIQRRLDKASDFTFTDGDAVTSDAAASS